ncbi:ribonuclease H-like protein [Xylaria castorea]|nr:ribonuclease H-like protein [Xylaria castorea]
MPRLYKRKGYESKENDDMPKHGPHAAGTPGGTCNRFPGSEYLDYMEAEAFCGVDNLEIDGQYGFIHVRCPWASTAPCSCGRHSLHLDSLVVAVDGACPGNGSHRATKSACGVFFGPDAPENLAFRVPDTPGYSHTSQRAELSAAIAAVEACTTYIYNGGQWECEGCAMPCAVKHLVLKSDSAYLVNGMTAHIENWRERGWRTAKNTEVKNRDLWTELYDLVHLLHADAEVAIDFWHVPRDRNKDADALANIGLEAPY